MRILYLTEETISFSDAMVRGGAIHVRKVVEGLRERGHEIHLVDWNSTPERPYQHSVQPYTRFVDGPLRTTRRAIEVGRSNRVDGIVSKTRKTYLPGLVAARRLGIPHLVHVGMLPQGVGAGIFSRLDATSRQLRLRAPHDGYLPVGDAIATELRAMGVAPDRIVDVKNAVDTVSFDPDRPLQYPDRLQAFAENQDGAFIVGYVGGLYRYKGTTDIPSILRQTPEDVRAVVVGDGPQRDRLAEALGTRGTMLGALAYDAMPAFYDTIDALLLPSYTEGLPRTILEAQAMETPVVATRVGGIPELVEDGSTGLLADPGDVDGLAQAIDRLKSNPTLARRLGRAGREQVLGRWTWEHLFDRYEMALEELLA